MGKNCRLVRKLIAKNTLPMSKYLGVFNAYIAC